MKAARINPQGFPVATTALSPHPLTRTAVRLDSHSLPILILAVAALIAALYLPDPLAGLAAATAGTALLVAVIAIRFLAHRYVRSRERLYETIGGFVELDGAPSFTTDSEGRIGYRNRAAEERFGADSGATLVRVLGDSFASPGAVLYRLQSKAQGKGFAREDVVMRRG
jgi:two-component system cell cycle sensor histidine kinase/response regulator CckA